MVLKTCVAENFRVCRWGAERRVSRAQTRERGPPSAYVEIVKTNYEYLAFQGQSFASFPNVFLSFIGGENSKRKTKSRNLLYI